MIKVDHLTKSFSSVKAVDDLSFEINQGEIVGFLGPNGAGKTTTMRMITGFISPDSGSITIDGKALDKDLTVSQARIGYLPENNPLYKNMLVSELLALSADLKHIPKEKRKEAFDFAVKAVAIGDVFYRPVTELSKGYKQRVGIAIALLNHPDILIMDEPTEGLDPNQRTEIRSLIRKLAERHTIIMSTHVMQEAQAVCSRMVIINKGKLIAAGTPQELAQKAKEKQTLMLDIEGREVDSVLKRAFGSQLAEIKMLGSSRLQGKLTVEDSQKLQPEISRLSREYRWVIWELAQEEQSLEDIFHIITKE